MTRNLNTGFSIKQASLNLNAINHQMSDQQNKLRQHNEEIDKLKVCINNILQTRVDEQSILSQIQNELKERDLLTADAISAMSDQISNISSTNNNDNHEQLQTLLSNITETISTIGVYDADSQSTSFAERMITPIPDPEFTPEEVDDDCVARDIHVIQMGDDSTDMKLSKNENGEELCTFTNKLGGILLNKSGIKDGWIIESSADAEMNVHYNAMSNTPLTITPSGISTTSLNINDVFIDNITPTITEESINNKTIPTTSAIVKYINANLKKLGIMKQINPDAIIDIVEQPTVTPELSMKDCNIGVVDVGKGKTLLIENETNSISFRDANRIITPQFTYENGLEISDKFSLRNDVGTLCIYRGSEVDLVGKFVKITKSMYQYDDLFVPEVRAPTEFTSDIYGIIKQKIENRYVYNNRIYKLDPKLTYVLVANSGIIKIPKINESIKTGDVLLPDNQGNPTNNYGLPSSSNDVNKSKLKEIKACISKCIPMIKVISFDNDSMFVQVFNG